MRNLYKVLVVGILFLPSLESCVMDTYMYKDKEGYLLLKIYNNAEDTFLCIDSLAIYNIALKDTITGEIYRGNIILTGDNRSIVLEYGMGIEYAKVELPEQEFTRWLPNERPSQSTKAYIKLCGKIYQDNPIGDPLLISDNEMYTAVPCSDINGEWHTQAEIAFYENCPIYCLNNGILENVLLPIEFTPSVTEWE